MKQRLLFFVSMLLVAFQIFISLPIAIWLHNQFNFSAALSDSIGVLASFFLAVSILLLLLALATPKLLRNYIFPFFVLGSVLIYIQQYILIWDYGVLDGTRIDFSNGKYRGLIDSSVWLLGAFIFVALRKKIIKHAKIILTFTMILTIVATLTTVMSHDFTDEEESFASINKVNKFTYSVDKNIFLFLLDGFQSDLFWEMIDKDPQLREEFANFTFYANTSSVFAKTYPTIPLLLTGKRYEKQQSFQEFLKSAYQDSILTDLIRDGWDVGLYPYVEGTVALDSSIMSNFLERTQWPEKIDNYLQALDISLFQSVPHPIKPLVYNDGGFIITENFADSLHAFDQRFTSESLVKLPNTQPHQGLNFRENLRTLGTSSSTKPTFRFYHLFMPHEPFLLNRNLEFGRIGDDFSSYQEYASASLTLMISYLRELKNLGAYDNSAIIIAADHGGGEYTKQKYISSERRYVQILKNGKVLASGKPLLLVKNYQDDSPFRVSSKPVSLLDVAPTIASFADIRSKNIEGRFLDEIAENEQRERTYFHYNFSGTDSKFLNEFSVYKINGSVYDENAWTYSGKLAVKQKIKNRDEYVLGTTMGFGSDLKSDADYLNAFLVGNSYKFAPSYAASTDGQIFLSFSLDSPLRTSQIYLLEIDLSSTGQDLNIETEVNRKMTSSFTVQKGSKQYIFLEPKNMKEREQLNIRIRDLDYDSGSDRLLISRMRVQQANLAELTDNSTIKFSDNLENYYMKGVWPQESWGRWTSEPESVLHFSAGGDFCDNTYLVLDINHFFTGVNPDSLEVFLNDRKLAFVKLDKSTRRFKYYFNCSGFGETRATVNTLTFKTDKVQIPLITGRSEDPRSLGAGLVSLKFVNRDTIDIADGGL